MIKVKACLLSSIFKYAIKNKNYEICGYLLGLRDKKVAKYIYKMTNIHKDKASFFMLDKKQQVKALQFANKNNLKIIGIFHSHPRSRAYPSQEDIKYMQDIKDLKDSKDITNKHILKRHISYLIVSILDLNIKAFYLDSNIIKEEQILIY